MPSGEEGSIKSITISGKRAELARAGDSADVTLSDIDAGVLGAGLHFQAFNSSIWPLISLTLRHPMHLQCVQSQGSHQQHAGSALCLQECSQGSLSVRLHELLLIYY